MSKSKVVILAIVVGILIVSFLPHIVAVDKSEKYLEKYPENEGFLEMLYFASVKNVEETEDYYTSFVIVNFSEEPINSDFEVKFDLKQNGKNIFSNISYIYDSAKEEPFDKHKPLYFRVSISKEDYEKLKDVKREDLKVIVKDFKSVRKIKWSKKNTTE